MNGQNIQDRFDVLVDGLSELGASEKLELANRIYRRVVNVRLWEEFRATTTVVPASNSVTLPADFKAFADNETGLGTPYKHVLWQGTTVHPIVRMAERKKFSSFTYYNKATGKLVTPNALEGKSLDLDYYKTYTALTISSSPVFQAEHHDILPYLMAVEHYAIDQSERGRSKAGEYQAAADEILENMEYDDSQLKDSWIEHA
jgi:hypothetical protein